MGAGIEAHEAYPRVMADRLAERERRIEIFNVALWGWSTRQERIAYEKLVRRYRPDQVVVAICLNDIPELQNNLSRPPRWLTYLHQHSAFVRALVNAERREISSVEELFAKPDSRKVREGMRRFFDELTALNAQVRADGASVSLLIFPFRFQLQPEAPPPVAQQAIVGYARKMSLPVIDLLPAFKRAGDEVFMDYDHLSPSGARLTAEIILESGWLPEGYSDSRSRAAYRVRVAREDSPALWLSALSDPSAEVREVAAKRLAKPIRDRPGWRNDSQLCSRPTLTPGCAPQAPPPLETRQVQLRSRSSLALSWIPASMSAGLRRRRSTAPAFDRPGRAGLGRRIREPGLVRPSLRSLVAR